MATGCYIPQCRAEYSENLLPSAAALDDDANTITEISSGGASAVTYTDQRTFFRAGLDKSVQSYNDTIGTPLVWDLGSALEYEIPKTGDYILSIKLLHEMNANQYTPPTFIVKIFVDGVNTLNMDCELPAFDLGYEADMVKLKWYTFGQTYTLSEGQTVNFRFEHSVNPSSLLGTSTLNVQAMKLELDDRNLGLPSVYSKTLV